VALIHNPKLLLLDEPTLGLDVEATENVKQIICEIAAEGRAILLTTHQLDIAEELSHRVAIIQKGRIVVEQATSDLIRQFSGTAYAIELSQPMDLDRANKIGCLGGIIQEQKIYVRQPEMLYAVLDVLRPLPIVKIEKDQANLTEIFLQVIQKP
jgi:ABC-2 type transport system ATP-binding protein